MAQIHFQGNQILFKRQYGNVMAFDPACCCDDGFGSSGSGSGSAVTPFSCCPCPPECLQVAFTTDAATCLCWDGIEYPITRINCTDGSLASFSYQHAFDGGGDLPCPDEGDNSAITDVIFDFSCDPVTEEQTFILSVSSADTPKTCPPTVVNLTLHSCSPFHLTGDLIVDTDLDLDPAPENCTHVCPDASGEEVIIHFEITEAVCPP